MTSTDAPLLLELADLSVTIGNRTILDRVALSVAPGEIVTLIGPNGAGKTTLVRAVLGLIPPSAGHIRRRAGLRLGYMPQKLAIDPTLPLTVGRFLGLWGRTGRDRIAQALGEAGVAHLAGSAVQTLSGGEMQRVLLARALLADPELLVLDEPDQGLDLPGRAEFFARIEEIRHATGCGVLMVSHDLVTVMARTDTVVCVDGSVRCSGPPDDVREHPEFAAMFGHHAGQFAVYHHRHYHDLPRREMRHG